MVPDGRFTEPIIAVSARDEGSKVSVMPSTHQRDQISAIDSHENKKSRATSARIFAAWPDGNDPWKVSKFLFTAATGT